MAAPEAAHASTENKPPEKAPSGPGSVCVHRCLMRGGRPCPAAWLLPCTSSGPGLGGHTLNSGADTAAGRHHATPSPMITATFPLRSGNSQTL